LLEITHILWKGQKSGLNFGRLQNRRLLGNDVTKYDNSRNTKRTEEKENLGSQCITGKLYRDYLMVLKGNSNNLDIKGKIDISKDNIENYSDFQNYRKTGKKSG
jgi:hypothetical protein